MRPFIPYFIACGLVTFVILQSPRTPSPTDGDPKNIYDSALLMLKDLAANDSRLGFANAEEITNAWIDINGGLSLVYLSEDTLLASHSQLVNLIKPMRRVIYPVYTKVGGITKLCASITFDSTDGLRPVMFDDSTLILPAIRHRKAMFNRSVLKYSMIQMPFLFTNAVIAHDSAGGQVVSTPELRAALGEEYEHSETDTTNGVIHIPDEHFIDAVKDAAN